ncbi:MAG: small subunit ribosomal protein S6 [Nitrospirae bacterium]|nr:MAG: small subunit ribosomal protein S6 [Nitrospirota bacterium]
MFKTQGVPPCSSLGQGYRSIWRCQVNFYETVVIINPSLAEDELKAALEKVADVVVKGGGEVLKVDNWGKRRLAYEMNKQKMGHYVMFIFKAPSTAIRQLETFFKVYDQIIKFMVIRLGKKQIAALPADITGVPVTAAEVAPAEQKAKA